MKKDKAILTFTFLFSTFLYGQNKPIEIDTLTLKKHIALKKPTISSNISKKEIEKSSGENLANLLKNISGITILQNGANISKPVIQGLTNQRIAILNNEVKIEGHHWGHDHSPEIDTFIAQRVEVIKGAEAVKYGANALGGVIVLKSDPLPYFGEKIGGKIQAAAESNSRKIAGNILLQGNIYKNNSFAWRIQTSAKKSGNYRTAEYYADNTGAREINYSASLGYKMPKEKIEFFYNYFSTELGVYRGSRVGSQYDWELRLLVGRPVDKGESSYDIKFPKQEVKHHIAKISLESVRDFGKLNFTYSFQKNHRQEYDIRRGPFAKKPTFDVNLSTHNINLDFQKKHNKYFKNYIGVNFSQQENYNIPGTGVNSVLPNYNSKTVGAYISEELKKNTWVLNAGIRFDYKTFGAAGFDALSRYYSGEKIFKNFSYNFGVNKTLGKYFSLTSNIGMAWRAPDAIELFADGVFHGNAFYVVGNIDSKSERGLKWSSNIQYVSKKILVSTDFFLQRINGFIYEFPTGNFRNTWAGEMPIFLYKQSDAFFPRG